MIFEKFQTRKTKHVNNVGNHIFSLHNKLMKEVNVDDNNMVASEYGVRSIPTLLIFKNGSVVNQIVGAVPKEKITDILDTVI